LFIICAEGLTTLIRQAKARGDIYRVKICRNSPIISHLLFADDCLLFFRANIHEATIMKRLDKLSIFGNLRFFVVEM
jgi:hypothetical protein